MKQKQAITQITKILLLTILTIELFFSQMHTSMTFDETPHIAAGYSKLITGDYRMNTEHPPLMNLLQGMPLLLLKPKINFEDKSWTQKNLLEFTKKFFFEDNKNPKKMLFYARIPMMIITILLGWALFKWAETFGQKTAILALAIYTFEPNILAHGILATTDIGFAFFTFIAIYCYWKFFNQPTKTNLLFASITMALAQLTKYTAIFLWPTYILIILFTIKNATKQTKIKTLQYPFQEKIKNIKLKYFYFHSISLIIIAIITITLINCAYLFYETGTPLKTAMLKDNTLDKTTYPPDKIFGENKIIKFITEKIPNPMPYYYTKGLGFVITESKKTNKNIIFGKEYSNGAWHYFITAFSLKSTIALILLIALAIILPQKTQKMKNTWQFMLIPAIVLLLALSNSTKQIGIRYILAIFPLIILWTAAKITNSKLFEKKYTKYIILLIITAHAISSAAASPDYISYYNEFIGQENGWKYFTDSNTDWGQDFDKLVKYANCKPNIKIKYLGTNDLTFYGLNTKIAKDTCEPEILAISASIQSSEQFKWLKEYKPFDKIGNSILLYNITNCTRLK